MVHLLAGTGIPSDAREVREGNRKLVTYWLARGPHEKLTGTGIPSDARKVREGNDVHAACDSWAGTGTLMRKWSLIGLALEYHDENGQ